MLGINIGDTEVVGKTRRVAKRLIRLGSDDLQGRRLASELQVNVPATVESDFCAEVLDVKSRATLRPWGW